MCKRMLQILILFSSFIVYLSWGKDQSKHIYEIEWDIVKRVFTDIKSVLHPFILLPLLGQSILFFTLFQKKMNNKLILFAIILLSILILFILFIGIVQKDIKIISFALPFTVLSIYRVFFCRK